MMQTTKIEEVAVTAFSDGLKRATGLLECCASVLRAEGLKGASRALFLTQLTKTGSRPVVVLTPDQNSGEALLGDLKYFFHYEKMGEVPRFFPAWELLPYEHLSPLPEISGERLEILYLLLKGKLPFLVVPIEAAMQCVVPRSELDKLTFPIAPGETFERELLEARLSENGYTRTSLVENHGEFSVRGDIVDIYPPASPNPLRVEFFDDTVESIREFDVSSQVSVKEIETVEILPVREVCPTLGQRKEGVEKILKLAEEQEVERAALKELLDKIQHRENFPGIENLAPFFYSRRETLFNYLPADVLFVIDEEDAVRCKCEHYDELVQSEYALTRGNREVAASPKSFYLDPNEVESQMAGRNQVSLSALSLSGDSEPGAMQLDIKPNPPMLGRFDIFSKQVRHWDSEQMRVTIVAPTKGQMRRVQELLGESDLNVDIDCGYISGGFKCPDLKRVFVAEHEIFGGTHKHRYRRKPKSQSFQRGFKDLKPGDYIVHIDYGIGR